MRIRGLRKFAASATLFICFSNPVSVLGQSIPFPWENATVYFAMTDRFANGDPENDHSYGRGFDGDGQPYVVDELGHFKGGDFLGLSEKLSEGYFNALGVSAIWISPPFEQVHGWVGTNSGKTQMYSYHGYWPLDFTEVDANWGTEQEFADFVDLAHSRGIRILMDVVLNHAGYNTMRDMSEFGFGELDEAWKNWRPGDGERGHWLAPLARSPSTLFARHKKWTGPAWRASDPAQSTAWPAPDQSRIAASGLVPAPARRAGRS